MVLLFTIAALVSHSLPAWEVVGPEGVGAGLSAAVESYSSESVLYSVGACSVPGWETYGNYVYRSESGGDSWELMGTPKSSYPFGALLAITPDETLIFYELSDDEVYLSTDGGTNWVYSLLGTSSTEVTDIVTLPGEAGNAWATGHAQSSDLHDATCAYLWTTEDSGENWSFSDLMTTPAYAYAIDVSSLNTQTICVAGASESDPLLMRTTDGGSNWDDITPSQCAGENSGLGVGISPSDDQIILFSTTDKIYRSTDSGVNWTVVSTKGGIKDIAFSKVNPDIVLAIAGNEILISSDAGVSWEVSETLPPETELSQIAASFFNANTYFSASTSGFLKSSNSGSTWDWSNDGFMLSSTYGTTDAISSSSRMYMVLNGGVSFSDDIGLSWTSVSTPPGMNPVWADLCRNPLDQNNVIGTGMNGEIFVTQDSGTSWATFTGSMSNTFCTIANPQENGVYYVGGSFSSRSDEYMRIAKTSDSGTTWEFVDLGDSPASVYAMCIDPSCPDTVYVGGDYYNTAGLMLYRSVDGGASWQTIQTSIPGGDFISAIAVSYFNSDLLLLTSDDGIYRSEDFGSNWTKVLDSNYPAHLVFDPYQPGRVWVWHEWYPVRGVGVSLDGGLNWEEHNEGLSLWKFVNRLSIVDPGWLYASTDASLFRLNLQGSGAVDSQSSAVNDVGILVSPNPIISTAAISYSVQSVQPVDFTLHDVAGRVVYEFTVLPQKTGANTFNLNPASFNASNGIYFLRIQGDVETDCVRIVICMD